MSDEGTPDAETLKAKMDRIANKMADELLKDGWQEVPKQTLEIFKNLCQYLAVNHRVHGPGDEEPLGDDFASFRNKIAAADK